MTVNHTSARSETASVALIHNWPLTLLSAVMMPLLMALGFWQLDRAGQKAQIVATIDGRLAAQPKPPGGLGELQAYTPISLLGFYTGEVFYLDNRMRDGQVGYEVLQVFVAGGERWLINRGWIAAAKDRNTLPLVSWPLAAQRISGFLYPIGGVEASQPVPVALDTGGNIQAQKRLRIQAVGADLAASLGLSRGDWTVRLSSDSDTAFKTQWQFVNSSEARHIGYAVQWFAMATALCILWLFGATRVAEILKMRKKK
ncbi:hypothetical protein Maes01_01142 [Microbulbifer aestuariivivens]|uniref:SURF1-like protein n=1 Tax=Microbulbifer aestuariivivens TaxID=1908308 RepID=A0ABP9WMZ3_9GAMM